MEHDMKVIKNVIRDDERAFYHSNNVTFDHVQIKGPTDGESAFKESRNIIVNNSVLRLRYPFWHNKNLVINSSKFYITARAPLWYCNKVYFNKVNCKGVKAIRECSNVVMKDSIFISPEIFWNVNGIEVYDSTIESVYAFFGSKNINISNLTFKGKYSYQYVKNMVIENSTLDTKDAFWHSENVTVKNSVIKGEYLGWYSKNLTLVNCKIIGTQPLCYCKNLTLIDCATEECDLAFEYSEVNGNIKGDVVSIKNPLKGSLSISGKFEYIKDKNDRSKNRFKVNK